MQEIVHIDLFAGIGGFAKGFQDAGLNITHHYFSEIDKHAIAVYKHRFPHAKHIGSVVNVSGRQIREQHPHATIIVTFGWPCQDNSIAGKRRGQRKGTRSGLLFEAGRIVIESGAQHFLAENVKGLSSVNKGYDFYETLRFLTYFNSDSPQYTLEMQLLNTAWVLPQNRERFYFVGHLRTKGVERILPIGEDMQEVVELQRSNASTLTTRYYQSQTNGDYIIEHKEQVVVGSLNSSQDGKVFCPSGISQTLSSGHGNVPKVLINSATTDGYEVAQEGDSINFGVLNSKTRRGRVGKQRAQTLDTSINQGVLKNGRIRRLTEIECERLQGFPDLWTEYGNYDGVVKKMSRAQRYKKLGNAVTVKLPEMLARKLFKL
jgi:DNA (cytosine-5)-methyltransferase 1